MARSKISNTDELPLSLDVNDIAKVLRICKARAYKLCHTQGFPSIVAGRRIIVPKAAFLKWMENPENFGQLSI